MAEALAGTGFRSGRPVRAATGELTVRDGEHVLALLTEVPGRRVDPGRDEDLAAMGRALATAHDRLADRADLVLNTWPWTWPEEALDRCEAPDPTSWPTSRSYSARGGSRTP